MITQIMINEALRYIGMPSKAKSRAQVEATELSMHDKVEEGFRYLNQIASPRVIYQAVDAVIEEEKVLLGGTSCSVQSRDLVKLLANSKRCVLMAATLGMEVDKQISLKQKVDMLDAIILDACASVLIDKVCDEAEAGIIEALKENEFLTMRFSPGYGDVPLETSSDLIDILQATKRMGLSLTKSHMLVPTKSVTAIIGISNQKENRQKSCGACNLVKTCAYRKRGEQCGL